MAHFVSCNEWLLELFGTMEILPAVAIKFEILVDDRLPSHLPAKECSACCTLDLGSWDLNYRKYAKEIMADTHVPLSCLGNLVAACRETDEPG